MCTWAETEKLDGSGDVVTTGTPAGIGSMVPGDVVEVEIEGIGVLRNRVV